MTRKESKNKQQEQKKDTKLSTSERIREYLLLFRLVRSPIKLENFFFIALLAALNSA